MQCAGKSNLQCIIFSFWNIDLVGLPVMQLAMLHSCIIS